MSAIARRSTRLKGLLKLAQVIQGAILSLEEATVNLEAYGTACF